LHHPEDLPAVLSLYKDIIAGKQIFASLEIRVRTNWGVATDSFQFQPTIR